MAGDLYEFARSEFRLSVPPKGSKTPLREQLLQVWKTTGKPPKEIRDAPKLPECLGYIWDMYSEVYTGCDLTYSEVYSWAKLTKTHLSPQETLALMTIDRIRKEIIGV